MASVKRVRGIRFFLWVSATLFILAGANWLFNDFIAISNSTSFWVGIGVLMLSIVLVGALLNVAYTLIPNVREILDGVLGLGKQETEVVSVSEATGGKRTTYV